MKVKDILALINSSHTIVLQYEARHGMKDEYIDTICQRIRTSMYGNPTAPVEEKILNSEVYTIYPFKDELFVYLKNAD